MSCGKPRNTKTPVFKKVSFDVFLPVILTIQPKLTTKLFAKNAFFLLDAKYRFINIHLVVF